MGAGERGGGGFRSGFVAVVGRPNVGKSTLTNRLAGAKVSIVTPKPQTTRNVIKAIYSDEGSQIVFLDTPGLHDPRNALGRRMVSQAMASVRGMEAVVMMVEAGDRDPRPGEAGMMGALSGVPNAVVALNKTDKVRKDSMLRQIDVLSKAYGFKDIVPVSALTGDGVDVLLSLLKGLMPVGPAYFPLGDPTDQPVRVMAAEMVREKALLCLKDEVPHGIGVEVVEFSEVDGMVRAEMSVVCEKEGHLAIVVGEGGAMLKRIGTMARADLERLLGVKAYVRLHAKARPGWRDDAHMIRAMGHG
ncbi:MAG: GTPase Era [Oscillospiraceae bacterium]|nr:GTPase Era [Oscillospiraceae bacterium]